MFCWGHLNPDDLQATLFSPGHSGVTTGGGRPRISVLTAESLSLFLNFFFCFPFYIKTAVTTYQDGGDNPKKNENSKKTSAPSQKVTCRNSDFVIFTMFQPRDLERSDDLCFVIISDNQAET